MVEILLTLLLQSQLLFSLYLHSLVWLYYSVFNYSLWAFSFLSPSPSYKQHNIPGEVIVAWSLTWNCLNWNPVIPLSNFCSNEEHLPSFRAKIIQLTYSALVGRGQDTPLGYVSLRGWMGLSKNSVGSLGTKNWVSWGQVGIPSRLSQVSSFRSYLQAGRAQSLPSTIQACPASAIALYLDLN